MGAKPLHQRARLWTAPTAADTPQPDLYRAYWDGAVESLFAVRVSPTGEFAFEGLNRAHEIATGLTNAQIAGRRPHECLPRATADAVTARYRACLTAGGPISYTEVLDLPSGVRVWETSLVPVRGPDGRINLLLGRASDVTEQRRAAGLVETVTGLLNNVLDAVRAEVAVIDAAGRIRMVNDAWRRFGRQRGAPADAYVGADYLAVCERAAAAGDCDAAVVRDGLTRLLAGEAAAFDHLYSCDELTFQLRAARFDHAAGAWIVLTHEDVTAAMQAERELSRAAERLLDVQEEERQRIARELHDGTSQHLVALQLGLATLRRRHGGLEVMEDMRRELAEAQKEIRTLSYLLHPPQLARDGLSATLRSFVQGFRRRTGLSVVLSAEGSLDVLPFTVQRAVFRVIQEALANVHRHTAARRVSIELTLRRAGLRLIVADDGRRPGDPPLTLEPGVGIPGMAARIERFGGRLSVTPTGFGARVAAFIPASGLSRTAA